MASITEEKKIRKSTPRSVVGPATKLSVSTIIRMMYLSSFRFLFEKRMHLLEREREREKDVIERRKAKRYAPFTNVGWPLHTGDIRPRGENME